MIVHVYLLASHDHLYTTFCGRQKKKTKVGSGQTISYYRDVSNISVRKGRFGFDTVVRKLQNTMLFTHTDLPCHLIIRGVTIEILKPTPNNRRGKSICASICLLVPTVNDIEEKKLEKRTSQDKNVRNGHVADCREYKLRVGLRLCK